VSRIPVASAAQAFARCRRSTAVAYEKIKVELRPGDVAVVYSDGVTGSRNPTKDLYDTQENRRLLKCIKGAVGEPEAVAGAILRDIREFSRGHV
jgi:serine phosphatase RsbU (regulator of sigma subunit)